MARSEQYIHNFTPGEANYPGIKLSEISDLYNSVGSELNLAANLPQDSQLEHKVNVSMAQCRDYVYRGARNQYLTSSNSNLKLSDFRHSNIMAAAVSFKPGFFPWKIPGYNDGIAGDFYRYTSEDDDKLGPQVKIRIIAGSGGPYEMAMYQADVWPERAYGIYDDDGTIISPNLLALNDTTTVDTAPVIESSPNRGATRSSWDLTVQDADVVSIAEPGDNFHITDTGGTWGKIASSNYRVPQYFIMIRDTTTNDDEMYLGITVHYGYSLWFDGNWRWLGGGSGRPFTSTAYGHDSSVPLTPDNNYSSGPQYFSDLDTKHRPPRWLGELWANASHKLPGQPSNSELLEGRQWSNEILHLFPGADGKFP